MKRNTKKTQARKPGFFVIAHNIRSLYNVGSIFRTAEAFGAAEVFLTGYTGHPAMGEKHASQIAKTALGAEKWLAWQHSSSVHKVIRLLKAKKVKIVALENCKGAKDIFKFKPKGSIALLLGEETKGIAPALLKHCDSIVEIPMKGKKESLNVSVAFGIAACHFSLL